MREEAFTIEFLIVSGMLFRSHMTHADDRLQLQFVWSSKDQSFCKDCCCFSCSGTLVHQAPYVFTVAGHVGVSKTSHMVR